MKKAISIVLFLLISAGMFAQEGISYKALIKDNLGAIVATQSIDIRFTIISDAGPTNVYTETHTGATTDANGIVILTIGDGTTSDTFTDIAWGSDIHYLKIEIDIEQDASFVDLGTTQFMSVPYVMQATNAENGIPSGGTEGQVLRIVGGVAVWIDNQLDFDGDGYSIDDGDCNDYDAAISPGGIEIIDGVDNNCDGQIDEAVIGQLRAGNVVFWVDPVDNYHGLVCAFSDYDTLEQWGCDGTDLSNVPNVPYNDGNAVGSGAEIGDGFNNTNNILNDCATAPAALAARSYGPDWFLPSAKELNEMYVNKLVLENVAGFSPFSGVYWSSTEISDSRAWTEFFFRDFQLNSLKNFTYSVRAVRAF